MSQAFEYGGIDREPVQWAKEKSDDAPRLQNEHRESAGYFEPIACDLHSDIEHMLITQ